MFTRYRNPFAKDFSSTYESFQPSFFLKQRPLGVGYLSDIALVSDPNNSTYADAAIDFRTALYVCQSGKYKFHSPKSDDISLLWLGDQQVNNATRDNADFVQAWYGDNSPRTVEKELQAGVKYPIRVLWGNTNGAGFLNLEIFAPNGMKLTESSKDGYLWINSC
ncbi:GLEYA motif domain-containing protein [Hirsutella rhossiliensis]